MLFEHEDVPRTRRMSLAPGIGKYERVRVATARWRTSPTDVNPLPSSPHAVHMHGHLADRIPFSTNRGEVRQVSHSTILLAATGQAVPVTWATWHRY